MLTFESMHIKGQEITELSNILTRLVADRAMCDNSITVELLLRYFRSVDSHLMQQDTKLYSVLLSHPEGKVNNSGKLFMSGSLEVKRAMTNFKRRWCKNGTLKFRDHNAFLKDADQMFDMVLTRLQIETEQLYPLVRRVTEERKAA